jgi:thiamine-phosphate pyrophosphorylase
LILHLVTDHFRLCGAGKSRDGIMRCLLLQARHAIAAGVDVVQVREPSLDAATLSSVVSAMVLLARGSATRIVVNDRLDVALACGAGGVHLKADSVRPASARSIAPAGFSIGQSVHSVEEAAAAASDVDYLIAGTVWPSRSKHHDHRLIGTAGLGAIAAAVRVPVLAIGGVSIERVRHVATAGAAGIAAIGLFIGEPGDADRDGCRAVPLNRIVSTARLRFDTPPPAS